MTWRERLTDTVTLLSRIFVVSLLVLLLSIPVVTILPAFAAGCGSLRRTVDGEQDNLRAMWRDFAAGIPAGWLGSGFMVGLLALGSVNLGLIETGVIPGGIVLKVATGLVMAGVIAVSLMTAAEWRPGMRWRVALHSATQTLRLPRATLLMGMCMFLAALIVWMWVLLGLVVPGLMCFAGVSISRHAGGRWTLPI